jgi:DNA-binding response OmpR family regulator
LFSNFANHDAKTIQRMGPMLQRVLIVDPLSGANVIAEHLRSIAKPDIWVAATNDKGLKAADRVNPQLIFVELAGEKVDGIAFTQRLRRSEQPSRKAPVILVTSNPTPAAILAARDAGVHEFLRKPFTYKDLVKRLEAVTLHPRDWIEAVGYIGPDRRRFNSGDYSGPLKRHADTVPPDEARIGQALKILKSALLAVEQDRAQAIRALVAQANALEDAAKATGDQKLLAAVMTFHHYLYEAGRSKAPLSRVEVERRAVPLLAFMPADYDKQRVVRV